MKILFVLILGLAAWVVVAQPRAANPLHETWYHAEITLRPSLDGQEAWILPFDVSMQKPVGAVRPNLFVVNGDEYIPLSYLGATPEGYERYDIPYFSGELMWRREAGAMRGFWIRPDRDERYPLVLTLGRRPRFALPNAQGPEIPLADRYALRFHAADQPADEGRPGIAVLQQGEDGSVTGTIMTESGDYRYLAGTRRGNRIHLSTFNGVFAYVFEMELLEGGSVRGRQILSATRDQILSGTADPEARLADPASLSSMLPGIETLSFTLPHYQTGVPFSPELGTPVIIQIMGSWCPNCVDESNAFRQFHAAYPDVQFVGITFERSAERETAVPAVDKFVRGLDLRYPILFGGRAERGAVERALPGLGNFHSYPTTIYLDKKGRVRKIYSGFYGPGTPEYEPWLQETRALIEKLRGE